MNSNNKTYQEAIKSICNSIKYMIDQATKQVTQIYNGVIITIENNNYTVQINGLTYNLTQYGNLSHSVGDVVKVFVPQGNMNMAFFI